MKKPIIYATREEQICHHCRFFNPYIGCDVNDHIKVTNGYQKCRGYKKGDPFKGVLNEVVS